MARPLTSAQREELGGTAYELSIRGYSMRQIATEIGVARATVKSLLEEQRRARWLERGESIERTLDGIDAAMAEAWRRLDRLPTQSASNAGPGLLNSINSLARTKAEILGMFAPRRTESKVDVTSRRDLSALTDEQLVEYHQLADKLLAIERQTGQLPTTGEDSLVALPGGDRGRS